MTGRTAYRAARVLTSETAQAMPDSAVLVDAGRIVAVVGSAKIPADYATVDLGNAWLLPGLIDLHVHLVWDGGVNPERPIREDTPERTALESARRAGEHLWNGVTTVRDCGGARDVVLAVRSAVRDSVAWGARVVAAGELISHHEEIGTGVIANGPEQVRDAVHGLVAENVDLIKVRATQGVFDTREDLGQLDLGPAELRAAVAEAHAWGIPVAAHAYHVQGIRNAIDAGVDTLEHASFLDRETAARAGAGGQILVPTLLAYRRYIEPSAPKELPSDSVRKARLAYEAGLLAVAHAREHGVPIGAGSDAGGRAKPHGCLSYELEELVHAGLSHAEAIAAATTVAARALGRDDLGKLSPGSHADFIGVRTDPRSNVSALHEVDTVVASGCLVKANGVAVPVPTDRGSQQARNSVGRTRNWDRVTPALDGME